LRVPKAEVLRGRRCDDLVVEDSQPPASPTVAEGDRFRTTRATRVPALTGGPHRQTWGFEVDVPAGLVVVAVEPSPGATAFGCIPEDERVRQGLVPEQVRSDNPGWSGYYHLIIGFDEVSDLLEPAPAPPAD
jgi:hypothetical protein